MAEVHLLDLLQETLLHACFAHFDFLTACRKLGGDFFARAKTEERPLGVFYRLGRFFVVLELV